MGLAGLTRRGRRAGAGRRRDSEDVVTQFSGVFAMTDYLTDDDLLSALQGDAEGLRRLRDAVNRKATAGEGEFVVTQQQFDAAVKHRARGVAEYHRFQAHFPDIVEDEEQY